MDAVHIFVHIFVRGSLASTTFLETTVTLTNCQENNRCSVARALGKILYDQLLVLLMQKWFISGLYKGSRHSLSH